MIEQLADAVSVSQSSCCPQCCVATLQGCTGCSSSRALTSTDVVQMCIPQSGSLHRPLPAGAAAPLAVQLQRQQQEHLQIRLICDTGWTAYFSKGLKYRHKSQIKNSLGPLSDLRYHVLGQSQARYMIKTSASKCTCVRIDGFLVSQQGFHLAAATHL